MYVYGLITEKLRTQGTKAKNVGLHPRDLEGSCNLRDHSYAWSSFNREPSDRLGASVLGGLIASTRVESFIGHGKLKTPKSIIDKITHLGE